MLPNLLHPIAVEVETLDRVATIVDPDYNEPVQQGARGSRTTCPGQIQWKHQDQQRDTLAGVELASDGYIIFRTIDMRALGLDVKLGDRFVSIGTGPNKRDVDLYVTSVQPCGHYQDQGGATMIKAFFKDRFPSKQTPGGK